MATTAMLKRRKAAAKKAGGKTKAVPRRKRGPTETFEPATPTQAPYEWDHDDTEQAPVVNGQKSMTTRVAAVENLTDTSDTESDDDDEEIMEVNNSRKTTNLTVTPPPSTRPAVREETETFESLQGLIDKLQERNTLLSRQIKAVSKMGTVDRYEVMQLRKMVKEDLFKRVKFITTVTTENKCLQYLSNKFNVPQDTKRDWCATYAHCVRNAINNKRNNVSQDLKMEIKGETNM